MTAPDFDDLDRAVLAATVDGAEPVLANDTARLARGLMYLAHQSPDMAHRALGFATRRIALLAGPDAAIERLLAAAAETHTPTEQALTAALRGVLEASVPKL